MRDRGLPEERRGGAGVKSTKRRWRTHGETSESMVNNINKETQTGT